MPSPITTNRKMKSLACFTLALAIIAPVLAVKGQTKTPEELEAIFSDARAMVQRKTPGGPHKGESAPAGWTFSPGGKLYGQFVGLKTWVSDVGVWNVEGKKLCTKWQNWENGKKHCYFITVRGDTSTIGDQTYMPLTASGSDGLLQGDFTLVK